MTLVANTGTLQCCYACSGTELGTTSRWNTLEENTAYFAYFRTYFNETEIPRSLVEKIYKNLDNIEQETTIQPTRSFKRAHDNMMTMNNSCLKDLIENGLKNTNVQGRKNTEQQTCDTPMTQAFDYTDE